MRDHVVQWLRRVKAALIALFGPEAPLCKAIDLEIRLVLRSSPAPALLAQKVADLQALVGQLNALAGSPLLWPSSQPSRPPTTKQLFIIHGHDELNTRRLKELLQNEFKLEPIVMLDRAGMTRPLTDKFEDNAQTCTFAFALLTPDDQVQKPGGKPYNQARPNAIYEAGWFVGRLGRQRIALLLKEGTEIHSDLDGVSQIRFKDNVEEKFLEIQRELRAAELVS